MSYPKDFRPTIETQNARAADLLHARVNGDISDLFFNYDTEIDIILKDGKGNFAGYDHDKLRERAEVFLGSLSRLGVEVPSIDDLTADFYGRV